MTIARRLYILIASAVAGMIALAGMSAYEMQRVYTAANFSNVNVVPSMILLQDAAKEFGRVRVLVYQHVIDTDAAKKGETESGLKEALRGVEKAFKDYEPLVADEKDKTLLANNRSALAQYEPLVAQIIDASTRLDPKKALALLTAASTQAEKVNHALDAHNLHNVEISKRSAAEAVAVQKSANL
jgi:methyl-accepting chemotaxis protein